MENISGLDFMSPNERERYIKQQLDETRKRRLVEARKAYSSFTKSHQKQFAKQKAIHEAKKAKAIPIEEKERLHAQIASLQARLDAARGGLGAGQNMANDMLIQEQKERAEQTIRNRERERTEADRFAAAISEVRANDPRLPGQQRAQRINQAKQIAIDRGNRAVENFAKIQKQREEEDRAQEEAAKQAEYDRRHPKLYLEDFARTFYHADIGLIPVTHEAVQYAQEIEKAEKDAVKEKAESKRRLRERTAAAAHRHQVEKDTEQLERELAEIKQIELNAELKSLKEEPQKEHPTAAAYCMDERERKRQARIQRFLALNDEAPKPRGPAPKPQPMHLMTSPVASEDEDYSSDDL